MKILLPVDGSDYTRRMLDYVAAHDELLRAGHECTVFTAVGPIPAHATRLLDRNALADYYRRQADEVLKPVTKFADQNGWKVHLAHSVGPAAEAIAAQAEAGRADLIVMGEHGQAARGDLLLGSVATEVLARCRVPVLLVR